MSRTTSFQYDLLATKPSALPLAKKKVAEGTSIEQHTAYGYDNYGHTITTTVCASNFDECAAGATNPAFRTTRVSYDPAQYSGGASALSYGKGRFPVAMTNALEQVEYMAYDELFGAVTRTTDVNGVSTCYAYDAIGWKTAEILRCGATKDGVSLELRTGYSRFRASSSDATYAAVVTVTSPPNHNNVWSYADGLGRTVEVLSRAFDGGFVETLTEFDHLGRVARTSKPFFPAESRYWTTTEYDWLNRAWRITQELGPLDGDKSPKTDPGKLVQTIVYDGSSTTTTETLAGNRSRSRTEKKNSLGKVSEAVDAKGSSIYYSYDSEGNLTDTHMLTRTGPGIHLDYDSLGHKTGSTDPDSGYWSYGYDGFGDLTFQRDANGNERSMVYDALGRLVARTDRSGTAPDSSRTAAWIYDIAPGAGKGRVAAVVGPPDPVLQLHCTPPSVVPNSVDTSGNRALSWFSYDAFGNLTESDQCADGETFSTQYDYDDLGRQSVIRYPETSSPWKMS